ncbi:MAG TPA: ADP-ribosylation factor-like protein [Candidatus Deferrimicrobium sp.]|nr:ADP-ribosylation factor-like protein [Candidatus Deferrimicrobium sp.]
MEKILEKIDPTQKEFKIVIMGLDNSGKTSILLALQKKTNLLSYYSLKPTQGLNIVKIEDKDKTYSIWELGGQNRYRESYTKDLKKYIDETDKIIFVIDVQDVQRYKVALSYLEEIMNHLKGIEEKPELSIFLHKFDPELEEIESFKSEMLSSRLINRITSIIPSEWEYHIFKSSIYTIFEKTLIQ